MGLVIPVLVLGLIVAAVIALLRRSTAQQPGSPESAGDVLVYLLLAVAVGVLGFSLVALGRAAFPGGAFVFDPERQVASSLAGIVVAGPFAFILWRRQRERRATHPQAAGWTVYLSLIEAVFMTSFVVSLFAVLDWLIGDGPRPALTDVFVFGAIVVFHEVAIRATPSGSDAADLPRVIGSAAGLVTLAIGIGGLLDWGLTEIYIRMAPETSPGAMEPPTALAFVLTGAPVWWYRWLRRWPGPAGAPRNAWMFLLATQGLVTVLGAGALVLAQALVYLLTETSPAGAHFEFLPVTLAVAMVSGTVWAHHRRLLGGERTDPVRAYEYATAAIALGAAVAALTALFTAVLSRTTFVGSLEEAAISSGVVLLIALTTWLRFWGRAQRVPRGIEAVTAPRRFYLLGLGVIMALVGSGALIATLVFVFQAVLGVDGLDDSFVATVALFLSAGGAAWHLLRTNAADRELTASAEVVTPFDVTVICSHPGMLSARLPKQARVRVLYRSDDQGVVDDGMADAIVAAVGFRSSLVWVDETGFHIAPAR
ncbi:MAG: DUF5671 domain-containing protein [Actinobacteria bacterium]|nr:DUF5671 domain-containing protein [Actinomycetota bacterium]